MARLRVNGIEKTFQRRQVLRGVSLDVSSGEVVGLLGPNGAGKTTAFYMIVGLIAADQGKILLDSEDLTAMPMHQRARIGHHAQWCVVGGFIPHVTIQNPEVRRAHDCFNSASHSIGNRNYRTGHQSVIVTIRH